MTVTQCTCCFYRSTGARSSTSPHHCCYNWVLHVCLLPGGLMLKPLTKISASITLIMAGSHYLPLKPSVTWFLLVKHSLSCLKNFNLFSSQAAFAVTELRQGKGQEVTQLQMFCNRSRVRWDLLLHFTAPPALPKSTSFHEIRDDLQAPHLPCWLEQEGFWHHSQAFVLGCFHQTIFQGTFLYGCSKAGLEISPSPVVAQAICPSAALSCPLGTDGVCLVLEGGWDLRVVLGSTLPAWLCARCMWEDLSC